MALLIRAEELAGRINLQDAIDATEAGYRELAAWPQFAHPRQRVFAQDRRLTLHYGGALPRLRVSGRDYSRPSPCCVRPIMARRMTVVGWLGTMLVAYVRRFHFSPSFRR